jgi:hypothetical protein
VSDIEVSHHPEDQGYAQGDNAVEQAVKNSVSQRLKHKTFLPSSSAATTQTQAKSL